MNVDEIKLEQENKRKLELGRALADLNKLPAFKLLMEDYLVNMPLALTYSLSGVVLEPSSEHNVTKQLTAIALFKAYLENVEQEALIVLADETK